MRVVLFVHCFFPSHFYGTESYTLDLALNLRALGYDPIIVTAVFAGEPKNPQVITRYEYAGLPVYCIDKNYYPNTRIKDTYYQPEVRELLDRLLSILKPDLVHVTHLINHTGVLLEATRTLGIPTIATLTDFFGFCYNNKLEAADGSLCRGPNSRRTNCLACHLKAAGLGPMAGPVMRFVARSAIAPATAVALNAFTTIPGFRSGRVAGMVQDVARRPDILMSLYANYRAVIAPTRFLKDAYLANGLTVPAHNIRFGVDLPRTPKPRRSNSAPVKFGFIGQIAPHKGVDILVDAFQTSVHHRAELHIYGPADQDPPYMGLLRRKAEGLPVYFHDTFPKDRLADVLAGIDFLVIPSRWYENSPLVLLNALASHTPVIVSDVAGMTEFVEPGRSGFVFSRNNGDHLAQVIRAVANPIEARSLTATTEYPTTTRTMTREVVCVYESIVSK